MNFTSSKLEMNVFIVDKDLQFYKIIILTKRGKKVWKLNSEVMEYEDILDLIDTPIELIE